METALTTFNFPALAEAIEQEKDEEAEKIAFAINKYDQLGMAEAKERAVEGAVSYMLSKLNMNLIVATPEDSSGDRQLDVVRFDGSRLQLIANGSSCWKTEKLSHFPDVLPFDILKNLPDNITDHAIVFRPRKKVDPILCVSLPYGKTKQITYKHKERVGLFKSKIDYITEMVDVESPYFVAIARWE